MAKASRAGGADGAKTKLRIVVCGLEQIGYEIADKILRLGDVEVRLCDSAELSVPLDEYDAAIVVSGIFERIVPDDSVMPGGRNFDVQGNALLNRERELRNVLARKNGWACFLVRRIIDEVGDGYYGTNDGSKADLAKRVMNHAAIDRAPIESTAKVHCKSDEFRSYFDKFGVAQTVLLARSRELSSDVLALVDQRVAGLALDGSKIFFLPFLPSQLSHAAATELIEIVVAAVNSYRLKNEFLLPEWLGALEFAEERAIAVEIEALAEKLEAAMVRGNYFLRAKGILTNSGDQLVLEVANLLRSYFGFNCDHVEEYREDIAIKDEQGSWLALVEVKGVKAGIKREPINQVDSQRERRSLPNTVPGVFIVNTHMEVEGYEQRRNAQVAKEQVAHARSMNVLLIRTIDLIDCMVLLESKPVEGRRRVFLSLVGEGGGLMTVDKDGVRVVTAIKDASPAKEIA
jgi:hypothetical protein